MTDRTAIDTIKGYFYQFDKTILNFLQLENDNHKITIEGIEDIDVTTEKEEIAIQCKYHSKQEYKHSVLKKPIILMLNHFKEVLAGNKKRVKYLYYGHFKSGQEKLTLPLTVDFLKSNLLTYTSKGIVYKHHEDLSLNDTQLEDFLTTLEIDINAISYEDQLAEIIKLLQIQKSFSCDEFEAENFFYNNSLKFVSKLATENDISKRTKSKKDFLFEINSKKIFFHKWFVQYKGKKQLLSDLRKNYFSYYNISPFERFFLLEVNPSNYSRSKLKEIIHLISKNWSDIKSIKNPSTFCPYVYISGIETIELIELKAELASENFFFKDGFDFNGASFNPKSITEKATYHNKIKIKIIDDLTYLELIFLETTKTKEIYQFYINTPYFSTSNESIKHVQIQIEDINDIKHII